MIQSNHKLIILLGLLFSVFSCSSPPPPVKPPSYQVLSQGQQSGFSLQKTLIIENAEEFTELWSIHTGGMKTPIPIIDFKHTVVIASFLGEQTTGGYSIKVQDVIFTEKFTKIVFIGQYPTPGSMRTMQITQPFIMIKVDKTNKPIYFEYLREP